MSTRPGKALPFALLCLACLLITGCELAATISNAVLDGVLDFIESTTANVLEQAFPIAPGGNGG